MQTSFYYIFDHYFSAGGWVVNWDDISKNLEVIGHGEFAGIVCFLT